MTRSVASTRVLVVNDLLGTRREYTSPQAIHDCLKNNLEVAQAVAFCEQLKALEGWSIIPPSLGCAVCHGKGQVIVRWFADGEPEDAKDELALLLHGEEPEGGAV